MKQDALILVRGGGDLATGTIHRLWSAGLRVLVLETAHPAAIRRQVSLCEAVYEGETTVERLRAVRINTLEQAPTVWAQNAVPVLIDPAGSCVAQAKPEVLVDAILAKKNLGTTRDMAPLTIALGPGFTAGQDVDAVVETKRGHRLGRIIREGAAIPNTGIPGVIGVMARSGSSMRRRKASFRMCERSVTWWKQGRSSHRSGRRKANPSRSPHRSAASCAVCCAAATRSLRGSRWLMWTPAGKSFPTVS